MRIAVLGATTEMGRLVVDELLRGGHDLAAVVRRPAYAELPDSVRLVRGFASDRATLRDAFDGVDAVVSALVPSKSDPQMHSGGLQAVREVMTEMGVRRYVGIGSAGADFQGDHKSFIDRLISKVTHVVAAESVHNQEAELRKWAQTGLRWTVVRPYRLKDGPPTGRVEHHEHDSPKGQSTLKADLAKFMVQVLDGDWYVESAPLVANA